METNEVRELTPTEEILEIIRSGQSDQQIRDALDDYHENDIADVLPLINKETRERLYRILGVERLSEVFTYIDDVSEYLDELPLKEAAEVLENMDADDTVDGVSHLMNNSLKQSVRHEQIPSSILIRQYPN